MSLNNQPLKLPLPGEVLKQLVRSSNMRALSYGAVCAFTKESYDTVTYAPHTLFPSPMPNSLFEKALRLQPSFNELLWRVTRDKTFLTSSLKSTIAADNFTARLFKIYKQVQGYHKPITLAVIRSDYLMDTNPDQDIEIKQTEINTIACGSAGLMPGISRLHRATLREHNIPCSEHHLPDNSSADGLVNGLLRAWELYGQPGAAILFVVEKEELNIFDIIVHIYKIQEANSSIKVISRSLRSLGETAKLTDGRKLKIDDLEIAIVYYRSGYMPEHFTEKAWQFKLIAEQSVAIVCPSIDWHLVGTKKVQQELSRPGVLEKYLDDSEVIADMQSTFAGQYSLDLTEEGDVAAAWGIAKPHNYILKPQREGGGNNVYGENVCTKLQELAGKQERSAYILMERIEPLVVTNYALRYKVPVKMADMVSELGVYGVIISKDDKIVINNASGHLVKTKNSAVDEGGILKGMSVMDSPYLI